MVDYEDYGVIEIIMKNQINFLGYKKGVVSTYIILEELKGMQYTFPQKRHKRVISLFMIENGFTDEEIILLTGLSKKSIDRYRKQSML